MDSLHKGRKKHMKNELFSIGPFTVYGYGLMIGIGIIAAYMTAESRAKKLKLDPEKIFGLVLWCLIFGYLGSKILYCITVIDEIIADPAFILHSLQNGWVVYGGLIGGILGGYLYCRHKKRTSFPTLTWRCLLLLWHRASAVSAVSWLAAAMDGRLKVLWELPLPIRFCTERRSPDSHAGNIQPAEFCKLFYISLILQKGRRRKGRSARFI